MFKWLKLDFTNIRGQIIYLQNEKSNKSKSSSLDGGLPAMMQMVFNLFFFFNFGALCIISEFWVRPLSLRCRLDNSLN